MKQDDVEIRNAIITSAEITISENNILTAWLNLDYGGTEQGFGGYSLYLPKSFSNHGKGGNYAGHWIWRVMEVAGVNKWDKLKGKTIRVRGGWSSIEAIGHIVEDNWFCVESEMKSLRGGE